MKTLDLQDDGYIELVITHQNGSKETVKLDTFVTVNQLYAVRRTEFDAAKAENRPPLAAERCQEWLKKNHNLNCSAAFAHKLYEELSAEVERLEKKDPSNKPVETPEPTGSPSGRTAQQPRRPDSSNGA